MSMFLPEISIAELSDNLNNPNYQLIDIRSEHFYNGFVDPSTHRSGHLPNARHFNPEWLSLISTNKLNNFLAGKGIKHDKTLIIYGEDNNILMNFAIFLVQKGFKTLLFLDFKEYCQNLNNPLNYFQNYCWSVYPQWLNSLIENKEVDTYCNDSFMIFEVGYGEINSNNNSQHIPGAHYFDTCLIEHPPLWNLSSPEVIEKNLCQLGIRYNTTIILYSLDQLSVFRVFWALKWAGVKDVRFLNGGLPAWKKSGFQLANQLQPPQPLEKFGILPPINPKYNISLPNDLLQYAQENNLKLISLRTWKEYIGITSGYDYIPRSGEIPGAIWGFSGEGTYNLDDYFNPNGTLRNPYEMIELWQQQGIHYGDNLAFYCGTGWRAAIPWFLTQFIGWTNTLIFDGGWNAWQNDKSLPIQLNVAKNIKKSDAMNKYK